MVIKPSTMPRLLADAHGNAHNDDLNLRAAYVHVVADAVTSLLAIVAPPLGRPFGWEMDRPDGGARRRARHRVRPISGSYRLSRAGVATALVAALAAIAPASAYTDKEIAAIFQMLDTNGDGKVTREEFSATRSRSSTATSGAAAATSLSSRPGCRDIAPKRQGELVL